jgi:chromosome segregation ATPase
MADASEVLKDIELPEEVKTKVLEKINPLLTDYDSKLVDADNKLKEAIQTRQKAKERVSELEAQIASGNTQAQELLTAKTKEIERLDAETKKLSSEKDELSKVVESVQSARKKELIEKVPEGKLRDSLNKISDLSLLSEQVEAILESLPEKGGSFNSRAGGKIIKDGVEWDGYTASEKEELRKNHFNVYDNLYFKKYGKHPTKE